MVAILIPSGIECSDVELDLRKDIFSIVSKRFFYIPVGKTPVDVEERLVCWITA